MPELNICEVGYCKDSEEVFIGTLTGNVLLDVPYLVESVKMLLANTRRTMKLKANIFDIAEDVRNND